jgi:hypothetical protein
MRRLFDDENIRNHPALKGVTIPCTGRPRSVQRAGDRD